MSQRTTEKKQGERDNMAEKEMEGRGGISRDITVVLTLWLCQVGC